MLIFTRRIGGSIIIGDDMGVTVMGINGAQVRIGSNASKDMLVDREEVRERKRVESGDIQEVAKRILSKLVKKQFLQVVWPIHSFDR
jgi:carbon storage regulator